VARNRRIKRKKQEQKEQENQHELEILQELLPKDGYVDDLTSPDENSPYVEQETTEECEECEACDDCDDYESEDTDEDEVDEYILSLMEEEADPWLWMEEYDGYDEEFYDDEDP